MARGRWGVAKPITVDGVRYASQREYQRWCELKLRERAGEIRGLVRQPIFAIVINGEPVRALDQANGARGKPLIYTADAAYFEGEKRVVEDTKGHDDPTSRLRRAIVQHIHKIEIRVVK